jgi:Flp pilus assembly protein TadG
MHTAPIPNVPVPVERANQPAAFGASFLFGRNESNPARTPANLSSVAPRHPSKLLEERSVKTASLPATHRHNRRRRGSKGAELVEFTLNFLPFMVMLVVLVDTSWAIFAQSTLQQAVRMAVRQGVTMTTAQVTGNLTDTVKGVVRQHAVGLLNGSSGLSRIKVHYFDQDNPSLDVSNTASGNRAGNIMQVSVEGYLLSPLIGRFFTWKDTVDKSPMSMTVYAADVIEPMATFVTPAIGPAP